MQIASEKHGSAVANERVRKAPFAPWPQFEEDEVQAAAAVLRSGKVNYWTGEEGRNFEKEFAEFTGCRHAVAVANGSVALELALHALGIDISDEVVVTSRSFIASASCVALRRALPVFADVDRESQNLTSETIRAVLSRRTKAVIAVHLAGWPCDMDSIMALAHEKGLKVIEDCAQAVGSRYKGRPVGSLGHVGTFSFCQDKAMSTGGEGGMLVTSDETIWRRAWSYKDHGKSYEAVYERQHPPGFRWLHESMGTNWRLTEMQSAIGRVLLRKLPQRVEKRRRLASVLTDGFSQIRGLRVTRPPAEVVHSYYKYYVFVDRAQLAPGWDRNRIMAAVNAEGVPCFSGSCSEIYLEKAFPKKVRPPTRLKVARELGETSLMFLVHSTLSEVDMVDTCQAVEKAMGMAVKPRAVSLGLRATGAV